MNEPCPSPAGIKRAQELYLRQFDVRIDPAEAQVLLTGLMRILQTAEKKGLRLVAPTEQVSPRETSPHPAHSRNTSLPGEPVSAAASQPL